MTVECSALNGASVINTPHSQGSGNSGSGDRKNLRVRGGAMTQPLQLLQSCSSSQDPHRIKPVRSVLTPRKRRGRENGKEMFGCPWEGYERRVRVDILKTNYTGAQKYQRISKR